MKFQCPQCKYRATVQRNLKIHVQAMHEGLTYKCDVCEFSASTPRTVGWHKKAKHTSQYKTIHRYLFICISFIRQIRLDQTIYTYVCAVIKSSSCPFFLGLHDTEVTLTLVCFLCLGSRCSANAQMFSWYQLHHLSNPNSKFKVHCCPSGSQVCWVSCVSGSKKLSSSLQSILSTTSEMLSTNINQN